MRQISEKEAERLEVETQRFYADPVCAKWFAGSTTEPFGGFFQTTRLEVASILPPGPIIDIGCGRGRSALYLSVIGKPSYIGVDPSEELLAIARTRFKGADFRKGDVLTLGEVVGEKCVGFVALMSLPHVAKHRMPAAL